MTAFDADTALATYGAGLDAELKLLAQLQALSDRQEAAAASNDLDTLQRIADDRGQVMAVLLGVEAEIAPLRATLVAHVEIARARPTFAGVASLHRVAADLVAAILGRDRQTLAAVRDAATARRQLAHTLETGGNTLAAYRRIIAPPPPHASLFDERG